MRTPTYLVKVQGSPLVYWETLIFGWSQGVHITLCITINYIPSYSELSNNLSTLNQ